MLPRLPRKRERPVPEANTNNTRLGDLSDTDLILIAGRITRSVNRKYDLSADDLDDLRQDVCTIGLRLRSQHPDVGIGVWVKSARNRAVRSVFGGDTFGRALACAARVRQTPAYLAADDDARDRMLRAALRRLKAGRQIEDEILAGAERPVTVPLDNELHGAINPAQSVESEALRLVDPSPDLDTDCDLDEKETAVIDRRFGRGESQGEAGMALGLGRSQVRRIETSALRQLRAAVGRRGAA